jgi:carbonic anhydrase/acetyltransferase-like protein (isoleucine patch superfamily)
LIYAFDGREPHISRKAYVSEQAIILGDVKIEDDCYVGPGAILRADYGRIEIGVGTAVEEGVLIHVYPEDTCRIGTRVTFGHGAIIHASQIGDLAVIGMGAVVSIGTSIGERSIVAEGTVVRMKQVIPPGVVVAGNPARVIRKLTPKDEKAWAEGKQHYVDLVKKYLEVGIHRIG